MTSLELTPQDHVRGGGDCWASPSPLASAFHQVLFWQEWRSFWLHIEETPDKVTADRLRHAAIHIRTKTPLCWAKLNGLEYLRELWPERVRE